MNKRSPSHYSQPAIHPSENFEARMLQPKHYVPSSGLDIYHAIQPPCEFEVTLTHHLLCLQLNIPNSHLFRQVSRFAGLNYDGSFPPGSFALIPARTTGFFAWNQIDESIFFAIEPTKLQQLALETDCLNPTQVELRPIVYNHDPKLEFFAQAFQQEMQNQVLGGQLYSESLANLFLIHLLRHYCTFKPKLKQYQGGLNRDRVQTAIDYIQANLDEKLTLDAIARQLNISQYHFCDLFKQSMGIPPYKYVLQQRVERAKQLLRKHREMAIVDIALECGFANQTHFHKHFRKHTGMTPKTYREH